MAQYRQSGAERVRGASGDQISIRIPQGHKHHHRIRRHGKVPRRLPAVAVAVTLAVVLLLVAILSVLRLSRHHQESQSRSEDADERSESGHEFLPSGNQSVPQKELKFGHGSGTISGLDSRYWDRDDRRRDHDYDEEDVSEHGEGKHNQIPEDVERDKDKLVEGGGRLYNEGGRTELNTYKEEYEDSLKNERKSTWDNGAEEADAEDEYDDGIDLQDDHDYSDHNEGGDKDDHVLLSDANNDRTRKLGDRDLGVTEREATSKVREKDSTKNPRKTGSGTKMSHSGRVPSAEKKLGLKRKPKHHKFSGSSCEMKFLNSTSQLVEPLQNKKFSRFSLQYTDVEERPSGPKNWEPRFAGHQTLQEREESFYARDQRINCGFIEGLKGSPSTGFDLAEDDVKFMSSCHIAVSSCIFGNSDRLRSPFSKTITRQSRKNVCFVMFLDENTLQTLLSEGQKMDSGGFIGLWKIVVVKNLPYTDMRRVGKIPKLLAHRIFPSARYSIWLDSKLRLQSDPYLILEYFLWRRGYEYAISNHYDRHCVWEEVMQNKKLNKFNHTIIDQQFQFYQSDGLKRFDPSDPNKLLPSYVPEGSFIVRTHTPMSNLFSCLWFNEVDRFTPRDQLSFAYTYLKLRRMNPENPFYLNMFKDCERRSVAKLFHHRAEEKRNIPTLSSR